MKDSLEKLCTYSERRGESAVYRKLEANVIEEHLRRFPDDEDYELLVGLGGLQYLLGKPSDYVRSLWRWAVREQLRTPLGQKQSLFFSMHAVLYNTTSREYFSWIDLDHLESELENNKLKPKLVITLIDDWYDVYRRLSAQGQLLAPVPGEKITPAESFVENIARIVSLLEWRSKEILTSELIARYFRVTHFVVAVKHPLRVVFDLIFSQKMPVYISHPITQVRELEAKHDEARREKANAMKGEIEALTTSLRKSNFLVPFSPTAIDELTIARKGNYLVPGFRERWPVGKISDSLFMAPPEEGLNPLDPHKFIGENAGEASLEVASAVLRVLWEFTRRQINSRDRKLVEQSKSLIVYRPYFNGHFARGVEDEIEHRSRLAQYALAPNGQRKCFVLLPPGDLAELRIKKLEIILKASAVNLNGKDLADEQAQAISVELLGNRDIADGASKGKLKASSLTKVEAISKLGFRDMPAFDDTLGEEKRLRQRRWLTKRWKQIADELNQYNPIGDVLEKEDKIFPALEPMTFIKRVERHLRRRLQIRRRGAIKGRRESTGGAK